MNIKNKKKQRKYLQERVVKFSIDILNKLLWSEYNFIPYSDKRQFFHQVIYLIIVKGVKLKSLNEDYMLNNFTILW